MVSVHHRIGSVSGESVDRQASAYVDGKFVKSMPNFNMPARAVRDYSFIGKSSWADNEYIDMDLDALRIYDYALNQQEISDLFAATHEKVPEEILDPQRDYRYTSWPITAYTFSNQQP